MADGYTGKVYREQGADSLVVLGADGGVVKGQASAGAAPAQAAAIADVATGGGATAAANATAINSILAALRGVGIIAP